MKSVYEVMLMTHGDWKIVSKILEELSDKYDVDVYIYSLTGY